MRTTTTRTQSRWYGAWVLAGMAAVMTPAILLAAGGNGDGFNGVVRALESRYHARPTRIPFMGLMSGIAGIATHGGVHNLHVVEFENFKGDGPDSRVDGEEFLKLVEQRTGEGWSRMIRETSSTGKEQTLIYVRPEGNQVGMLVVDLDGKDLDVVEISMNPDQLMKQVSEHDHHGRLSHDQTSDEGDVADGRNGD